MNNLSKRKAALILFLAGFFVAPLCASNLDTVGVTLLREVTTNVDGTGIFVAQPEAGYDQVTNWEVSPVAISRPIGFLTFISSNGSTTNFPNSLSSESGHADSVAGNFYGMPDGVATNVAHVDNYDADYFYGSIITSPTPPNINDPVVNQSFIFTESDDSHATVSDEQAIDSAYDDYAAQFNTLFVSGAGNGGVVNPPATCYNGIGVGVSDGSSSYGPTIDNGRCKPDIIAPDGATSFSTPFVAGAAAVLMQAGLRGDGGSDTNSAADIRTVKALLLNGAIKPPGWTNFPPEPLDTNYGAGVLNVFNSYEQLAGGKHGYVVSATVPSGNAHPPTGDTGTISVLNGWDFNTNTSDIFDDAINHYYFNVTNTSDNATFTATATLVWNRQQSQTNINNLDLFLYNCANSNLVACSTSLVDNVEQIFVPQLPQGRYDLQVWKAGGIPDLTIVSSSEIYALAWEFFSVPLNIAPSGTNAVLTWPVYPAGFVAESTTNLISPIVWSTNNLPPPVFTNNQNCILLGATNEDEFFRLYQP